MAQTIGKLPTRLFLPKPPAERLRISEDPKELAAVCQNFSDWARPFQDAIANTIWALSKVLVFNVSNTGQTSVGAATTSVAVAFEGRELDAAYQVTYGPSWNTKVWTTSKTVTGFTINVSDAPGGAGGTMDWTITR